MAGWDGNQPLRVVYGFVRCGLSMSIFILSIAVQCFHSEVISLVVRRTSD